MGGALTEPSAEGKIGGLAHVRRIERAREKAERISREIAYAVTSLAPEHADPDTLPMLWRVHWLIENRLHWRRDVILREDHSTIRFGPPRRPRRPCANAMLHLVEDAQGPLTETKETLAENRRTAIQVAQRLLL